MANPFTPLTDQEEKDLGRAFWQMLCEIRSIRGELRDRWGGKFRLTLHAAQTAIEDVYFQLEAYNKELKEEYYGDTGKVHSDD